MNAYELMYIVPTSYTEDELGTVEKNVAQVLEKNGASVTKTTRIGKLRFAYPIKHERYGHYVLVRFQAEASAVSAINEGLRLNQKEILRHMIVDGSETKEEFNLVQFQEVHVEGGDRRRRPREDKPAAAASVKDKKEQQEGVAALEGSSTESVEKPLEGIEELSEEDLQKKIDAALEEKAV